MTYNSAVGPRLLEKLGLSDVQTALADAGFAAGDQEHIRMVQTWMADYAARNAW